LQHRADAHHHRWSHRRLCSSHHADTGLDTERSWIITTELNQFTWPSPDLRPTAAGEYIYGYLPEKLMHLVLESVKKNARDKRLKTVPRTD
jgi:hypothetical protein